MQPKYYGAAANYNKGPGGLQFNKRLLVIIGGIIVLLIFMAIALGFITSASSAPKNDLQTLVARQSSLTEFLSENQEKIRSGALAKITAESNLLLRSNQQSLAAELANIYGIEEIDKAITTAEADTTSTDELTAAASAGQFDQTFVELFTDKLAATNTLAAKINQGASGDLRVALAQLISFIETISTELDSL